MKAVLKHELSSYFTNVTGYVFGAFLLLFTGLYTMIYNLSSLMTNFEYALGSVSFIFLIIVPVLTMKVLAEERRQKTDQLLYSLPLSMTEVILGKYLALLVVFLVPLAIVSIYPLVLTAFGSINLLSAFSTIIGFFFLGATLLAIGMFISSVTDSQAISAGLCFVVMLVLYYIDSLAEFVATSAFTTLAAFTIIILLIAIIIRVMTKSNTTALFAGFLMEAALLALYFFNSTQFEGIFPQIMSWLSLYDRYYEFVNGVFNIGTLVYFASISAVFLFLCIQSMEKRRWSE